MFSVSQILKRGCHVNDRDGLTDMTLLHYSCKAGAHGVGKILNRYRSNQSVCPATFTGRQSKEERGVINVINRKSQEKTKINNEPILPTNYRLFSQSLIELGFRSSAALKPGPYCVCRRPGSRAASQQSADLSGRRRESEESLDQHERSALCRLLRRPGTDPSPA